MPTDNPFARAVPPFDLRQRACQEMREEGFLPDFPEEALIQAQHIVEGKTLPETTDGKIKDLRHLLWSSIDNRESRDLDQIEVAERLPNGNIQLRVAIADVDALVSEETPVDRHAARNAMSVYTGVSIFPMLPEALSEDVSSLLPDVERLAMVTELEIDEEGEVVQSRFFRALTRNYAKLNYEEVDAWLNGNIEVPESIASVEGLEAQIRLQEEVGEKIRARRIQEGALEFETIEAFPVVENGKVVGLRVPNKNKARLIIENFMISVNMSIASFLERNNCPSIQRVVRTPRRWSRIVTIAAQLGETLPEIPDPRSLAAFLRRRKAAAPAHYVELSLSIVKLLGPGEYAVVRSSDERAGHFGLAAYSYTHSTAPNRRYADVVVQRSLKAVLAGLPAPYTFERLEAIAKHCTQRENSARVVERTMRKVIAAVWMQEYIGEEFEGTITGVAPKGTFVRLTHPPVEGKLVSGEEGADVGDTIRVRLLRADPERGFIDFARISE